MLEAESTPEHFHIAYIILYKRLRHIILYDYSHMLTLANAGRQQQKNKDEGRNIYHLVMA
jgi:hypothetical protein